LAAALATVRRSALRPGGFPRLVAPAEAEPASRLGHQRRRAAVGRRNGDVVTIENIRNFEYRSLDDFTVRYERRTFHLAILNAADIIFFNWGSPWMSHPVLVFDFGSDGRVCMSIEVRYRKGQKYSILRSFYRQQELIFVAAEERDVILRRTKYGQHQEAHLYRFHTNAEVLRAAFLDYIDAIKSLHETPRWYNGLCANCTTTFYRLPHSRFRLDWMGYSVSLCWAQESLAPGDCSRLHTRTWLGSPGPR
jgi:hypothetical protein